MCSYVVVALAGGILLLSGAPNLSISGLAFSISIVVPFLNMTKQFSGNVSQVSNQINSIVMGLAGAQRHFCAHRRGGFCGLHRNAGKTTITNLINRFTISRTARSAMTASISIK